MRRIAKLPEPQVLQDNKTTWLSEFKQDKTNSTKKFRYRHIDIKTRLKDETGYKCIYCESKIGHNTPGDIEHIIPSSKNEELHFTWSNLTIACTECNRRKNDYFNTADEFLNPYVDADIEQLIQHYGPIVNWQNGHTRAEISIRILNLNNSSRIQLILRKIEKIEEINTLYERFLAELNLNLKKLLEIQLLEMANINSEYSGMVRSLLRQKGFMVGI